MTPPTRREHIAAIRERDASKSGGTSAQAGYDRRCLLGVVGELAAALRRVADGFDQWNAERDMGLPGISEEFWQALVAARALLADLGPDA